METERFETFYVEQFSLEVGNLTVVQNLLPSGMFNFERFYILHNSKKEISRGNHAHKELEQRLVCISGSCKVWLHDGNKHEYFNLDSASNFGLCVKPGVWRELSEISEDCVLIVFASRNYDSSDYIHSFQEFLIWKNLQD